MREVVELLGRIQHRLGRNAADIEAGAAERGLAFLADEGVHARRFQAELRRTDRGHITGRAGTDDDDVELFCHDDSLACGLYMPSSMRCGFSNWFLMSTRNSTASLPSMMRWS